MSEKLNRDNEQISNENSWDTSEFPAFDPKAAEEARMRATDKLKDINSVIDNEYNNSYFKIDENGKLEFNDAGLQPIETTKFYDKNGEEIIIEEQAWFVPPPTFSEKPTPTPEPTPEPTPTPTTETPPETPPEP